MCARVGLDNNARRYRSVLLAGRALHYAHLAHLSLSAGLAVGFTRGAPLRRSLNFFGPEQRRFALEDVPSSIRKLSRTK